MTRARRTVLLVVLAMALALSGCSDSSSEAAGRLELDGRAEVTETGGGVREISRSATLRDGEQVKILDGTATLSLGPGRELELRRDTTVRLTLEELAGGTTAPRAQLVGGDVLVVAAEQQPAVVTAGDTEVEVTAGAARVSTGLTVTVANYQGAAGVGTGGRAASVAALRQVSVPAPGLPSRPAPIVVDASHPWDQRYLGDAIDLGNQLASRSVGFTAQLRPGQANPAFFRQILPDLARQQFDDALYDPLLAPGETLVGAAITLAGNQGTFADRWRDVFTFHEEGASWGLVALDQGVDRAAVLSAVDAAIARVPGLAPTPTGAGTGAGMGSTGGTAGGGGGGQVAAPRPGATPTTAPATGGSSAAAPTTPTTAPGPTGGTGPGQPAPLPDRGPVDLGLPIVDDTLNTVIDALSGLLRALGAP